jgi:glutamate dehydrogenase/leucine dehydrogenase
LSFPDLIGESSLFNSFWIVRSSALRIDGRTMTNTDFMDRLYIVCGIGRIGRHIIDELYKTGRHFIAIDLDKEGITVVAVRKEIYI